eukprot:8044217-Pyramimonas_sp.AAC.1
MAAILARPICSSVPRRGTRGCSRLLGRCTSTLCCTTILPGDQPRAPRLPFTARGWQPSRAPC